MKFTRVTVFALILCFTVSLCSGFAAAATAGSAEDPLISKSYIDGSYGPALLMEPSQLLSEAVQVLQYKLDQAKAAKPPETTYYQLPVGGTVSLQSGSGFVLITGAAQLISSSGTVLDLTTGSIVAKGTALSPAHTYLAAENSVAMVKITSSSHISTIGSSVASSGKMTFTDVPSGIWYYNDVANAVSRGLINGYSETTFAPQNNLTIAETIKLAACMYQLYYSGEITLKNHTDVATWYKTYVDFALQKKIISEEYPDYNAKITRREFVHIFYHTFPASEYAAINTVADGSVSDIAADSSYVSELYTFYRAGIVTGYEDGRFLPEKVIARCEVAAVLSRMFDVDARVTIS